MLNSTTQNLPVGSQAKVHNIPATTLAGAASATDLASIAVPVGMQAFIEATVFAKDATADQNAAYRITAAGKNLAGTTALIGTVSVVALEEDATWVATVVADDTNDELAIQGTPDGSNDTVFWGTYTVHFQAI